MNDVGILFSLHELQISESQIKKSPGKPYTEKSTGIHGIRELVALCGINFQLLTTLANNAFKTTIYDSLTLYGLGEAVCNIIVCCLSSLR